MKTGDKTKETFQFCSIEKSKYGISYKKAETYILK